MSDDTVPFGRYRGKPVEDMLADTDYMAWLEGQPWFRARFAHLLARRDADAASRTPVHNRLQTLFLDDVYRLAFLRVTRSSLQQEREQSFQEAHKRIKTDASTRMQKLAADVERLRAEAGSNPRPGLHELRWAAEKEAILSKFPAALQSALDAPLAWDSKVQFEHGGADVFIWFSSTFQTLSYGYDEEIRPDVASATQRDEFAIEIKPVVADDYPAVLRQMSRNKSEYLFVDRYEGEGATEAQFVAIFAASKRKVVFKRDVDAEATKLREDVR